MIELEEICNDNLIYYSEYEKSFHCDLKQYQSRIYPLDKANYLRWYHIKNEEKYFGSIWLEKNADEDFSVLGIFISDKLYRNQGIGKAAIKKIIKTDLLHMHTNKILLRVREENERAIRCYESVGFKANQRLKKDNLNVIEMIYEVEL